MRGGQEQRVHVLQHFVLDHLAARGVTVLDDGVSIPAASLLLLLTVDDSVDADTTADAKFSKKAWKYWLS